VEQRPPDGLQHADLDAAFAPFEARMEAAGEPPAAIAAFRAAYAALRAGDTGELPEANISPVAALPDAERLDPALEALGRAHLGEAAVLKLNGGLGTSMGLDRAKSLLPVKGAATFLDLIARQALDSGVPLTFLHSFATQADCLAALAAWPGLAREGVPLDLLQHQVPKVDAATLGPATHPDPELTWCPPGHGDLYVALQTRGVLDRLRAAGRRYLFVSNADNLGATLDLRILGHLVASGAPFLMEVADRTEADRKGGHLARQGGQLVLREVAQCPAADLPAFQDIDRHRYFNTNNLWLDLRALADRLAAGPLRLPIIRNAKTVDPRDLGSAPVIQLETAMGAAISALPGAQALRVPRDRMVPVKTTADLLRVRSDATALLPDGRLRPVAQPAVLLPAAWRTVDALDAAFPAGPPSLVGCARFEVTHPGVVFGAGVVARGEVVVRGPGRVPDGATLQGEVQAG
jgi:UTP--glucose-1-phosphate uridylyltransferase